MQIAATLLTGSRSLGVEQEEEEEVVEEEVGRTLAQGQITGMLGRLHTRGADLVEVQVATTGILHRRYSLLS